MNKWSWRVFERTSFLREKTLMRGDFTLRSGAKSTWFFDAGALLDSSCSLERVGLWLATAAQAAGLHRVDAVCGIETLGSPFASAMFLLKRNPKWNDPVLIIKRKSPKDHGGRLGWFAGPVERLQAGASVLLVDDVLTTGSAAKETIALLQDIGLCPVGLVVLLDRREERGDFEVPVASVLTREEVM